MDRRGFLHGVFGGVTSAGLILAAKPAEIAAFASPLLRDQPLVASVPTLGQALYNEQRELVAFVSHIHIRTDRIETTMFGNAHASYMPRPPSFRIEAVGAGQLELDLRPGGPWLGLPRLRGSR